MALTRITKGVIKPNENYDTHNINSTGIITATKFVGPVTGAITGTADLASGLTGTPSITVQDVVAVGATFTGNVSIGGTLTYEDVTNIDSVGIITARDGLKILAGGANVVGVVTATTFKGDGDFVDIDVDGHTNLDNVSVAGVTTFAGTAVNLETGNASTQMQLRFGTNAEKSRITVAGAVDDGYTGSTAGETVFNTNSQLTLSAGGSQALTISSARKVGIGTKNPTEKLHISALGASDEPTIKVSGENSSIWLRTAGSTGSFPTGGSGNDGELLYFGGDFRFGVGTASKNLIFFNGNAYNEAMRIDSSRRLLIGHNASRDVFKQTGVQISGNTTDNAGLSIYSTYNGDGGPNLILGHSRNGSKVTDGTILGDITFVGHDNTDLNSRGSIIRSKMTADGADNSLYADLLFFTKRNAGGYPDESVRITSDGQVQFSNGSFASNIDSICANSGTMEIGAQSIIKFRTATNERLRISSGGQISIKTTGVFNGALLSIGNGNGVNIPSGEHIKIAPSANTITFLDSSSNTSDTGIIQFWNTVYNNCSAKIELYHPAANTGGIKFHTTPAAGSPVEALRIDSAGRLIVGTTKTAGDSAYYDDITINNSGGTGATGGTGINLISSTDSWGSILFGDSGDNNIGAIKYDHNTNSMRFVVNTIDPAVLITSAGKVGINESSPDSKLHISGGSNENITLKLDPGGTAGNYSELVIGRTSSAPTIQTTPAVKAGIPISGVPGILLGSENTNLPCVAIQTPNSSNGHIVFKPKGSEKLRIDSGGKVLIGDDTNSSQSSHKLQVFDAGAAGSIALSRFSASSYSSYIDFYKSRHATLGSKTVVNSGDNLGAIRFYGVDGSNSAYYQAAEISSQCDGASGEANDMPGRLTFWTRGDGTSSNLTERLRIDSDGNLTAVNTTSGATTGVTLKVGASAASGTNSGTIIINNGGLGNASLQFDYEGSAARAKIYVYRSTNDIIFDTSGTEKLRIKSTGEVHMGASSPTNNDGGSDDLIIGNTDSGTNRGITIWSNRNQLGGIAFADNDANYVGGIQYMHNGDYLRFLASGNETLRISDEFINVGNKTGQTHSVFRSHNSRGLEWNLNAINSPFSNVSGWVFLGNDNAGAPYPVRTFKIAAPEGGCQGTRVYQVWHDGDANYDYGGLYEIRINMWTGSSRFESVSIRCVNGHRTDMCVRAYNDSNGIMIRSSSIWGRVYIRLAGYDDGQAYRGSSYCAVANNGALAIYNSQGTDDGTVPTSGSPVDVFPFDGHGGSYTGGRDIENSNWFNA